jgi:hypothetical protein
MAAIPIIIGDVQRRELEEVARREQETGLPVHERTRGAHKSNLLILVGEGIQLRFVNSKARGNC